MAEKQKSRRRSRHQLISLMEKKFDVELLRFEPRCKAIRNKTKLSGVMVAMSIYAVAFAFAYFGYLNKAVTEDLFMKASMLLMFPATVIGALSWLVLCSRREFPVRDEIREHIKKIESKGGLLWCFEPLQEELLPDDPLWERMTNASKVGKLSESAIEDYADAVHRLYDAIEETGQRSISPETVAAIDDNFAKAKMGMAANDEGDDNGSEESSAA